MKKTLALLLAALMLCALLPAASLAEEPEYTYTVAPYTTGPLGEKLMAMNRCCWSRA